MTDQLHPPRTDRGLDPSYDQEADRRSVADQRHGRQSYGLSGLLAALRCRFWIALGACVLLMAITLTVFVQQLPTTYAATSIVALRSSGSTDVPADEQKLLAGEYAVFLSSPANLTTITDPYLRQMLGGKLAVTVDPDTTTLRIIVTTKDEKASVAVANGVASLAVNRGQEDRQAKLLTLAGATDSTTTTGPKRTLYLGAGFVLIAVVAGSCTYLKRRPA